jgi:hypothetical protein
MATEETKEPTREEVIAWYNSQIELASLRAQLAELQAKAVTEEAKRIQATIMIANMTAPENEEQTDGPGGAEPSEKN